MTRRLLGALCALILALGALGSPGAGQSWPCGPGDYAQVTVYDYEAYVQPISTKCVQDWNDWTFPANLANSLRVRAHPSYWVHVEELWLWDNATAGWYQVLDSVTIQAGGLLYRNGFPANKYDGASWWAN